MLFFTRTIPSVASYFEGPVFRSWAIDRLFSGFLGVADLSQASTEKVPLIPSWPLSSTCCLLFVGNSTSREPESSVGIVTYYGWTAEESWFYSRQGQETFLFQLSLGVRETDCSFPNAEARNRWRFTVECQSSEPSIIRTIVGKIKLPCNVQLLVTVLKYR